MGYRAHNTGYTKFEDYTRSKFDRNRGAKISRDYGIPDLLRKKEIQDGKMDWPIQSPPPKKHHNAIQRRMNKR